MKQTRLRAALAAACLLAALLGHRSAFAGETSHWETSGIQLLGALEFRGPNKSLPKWVRILKEAGAQVKQLNTCDPGTPDCPKAAKSWQAIINEVKGLPRIEQLKKVNAFFNKWPYRLDFDTYGVLDYWATPMEFLKRSGDCEDYAITKFYALKTIGIDSDDMRLVVLWDSIRGLGHAILAVYNDKNIYILDNVSSLVFPHTMYKHYVPQYSINEHFRWAHVKPGVKKKLKLEQLKKTLRKKQSAQ